MASTPAGSPPASPCGFAWRADPTAGICRPDSAWETRQSVLYANNSFVAELTDRDAALIGAAGVAGAGAALWAAAKWLIEKVLVHEAGRIVLSPFLHGIEGRMRRMFPPPLTPREVLIYETLYTQTSFANGVELLQRNFAGMTPVQALRYSFDFLFRHDPMHPLARSNPNPYILRAEDVVQLMQQHNWTPIQIYNTGRESADEFGFGKDGVWSLTYDAIFEASRARGSSQERLNPEFTRAQEAFVRQMWHERVREESGIIKDILARIGEVIRLAPSSNGDVEEVALGQFRITLRVNGRPASRFALVEYIDGIIDKLDTGTPFSQAEDDFVADIVDKNPVLRKTIDERTKRSDVAIRSTNLALQMVERSQLGEYPWFMRILRETTGCQRPVRVGIVVEDASGHVVGRYEFVNRPGIEAGEMVDGTRIALYAEGSPHPIPPFSFSEGSVFIVRGGAEMVERTIMVTEGRGRTFFITNSELEHYRRLAGEVVANPTLRASNIGRAFLRFYNKVQALAVMVFGDGYVIEPGSPEVKIRKLADELTAGDWGGRMEQRLEGLVEEFRDMANFAARHRHCDGGGCRQLVESAVDGRIRAIHSDYARRFEQKNRAEFRDQLRRLRSAILMGDVASRNLALTSMRKLIARQAGRPKWADLSLDLYEERNVWNQVKSVRASLRRMPQFLREVVAARGVDRSLPPSIERARRYVNDRSYERAFLEYQRVIADQRTPLAIRIVALAEKARLAVNRFQFQRARRAVEWIKRIEATGGSVPSEARAILDALPPLNNGPVIGRPRGPVAAHVADRRKRPMDTGVAATASEEPIDVESIKPASSRFIARSYEVVRDISGPAIFGALTFLFSGRVMEDVLGRPRSNLDALLHGYNVMGLAILIESGSQNLANYIVERTVGLQLSRTAVSFGRFFGGLGGSILIYKAIAGTVENLGASKRASEVTGLVGTGVAYGVANHVGQKLKQRVTNTVAGQLAGRAGGAVFSRAAGRAVPIFGQVLLAVDTVFTIPDAVSDSIGDQVEARAREEYYEFITRFHGTRGIFGDATDVRWYQRPMHSLFNILDPILVPPAMHKRLDPILEPWAEDWMRWCRFQLRTGRSCQD